MKKVLFLLLIPFISFNQAHKEWTKSEISNADVARDIDTISDFEKDIIFFLAPGHSLFNSGRDRGVNGLTNRVLIVARNKSE